MERGAAGCSWKARRSLTAQKGRRHAGGVAQGRARAVPLEGQAAIADAGVGNGAAALYLRVESIAAGDVGAGEPVL